MVSFVTQIEDMIGTEVFNDDGFVSQAIQDIGAEIVKVSPEARLKECSLEVAVTSSGYSVSGKRVLEVHKSNYSATQMTASNVARSKDSGSIYYATSTDPIYYFADSKVFIVIDGSEDSGTLVYVPSIPTSDGASAIVYNSTSIVNFPSEAVHILITGAAAKCLQQLISLKNEKLQAYVQTEEDVELAQAESLEIQSIQAQYALLEGQYQKSLQSYLQPN
tara:strand:- start:276 stop:935 length:660 start_codon:yes stop_codon:yes gene_type:complete